jgi:predicted dehydrogenase
VLKKLGVSPIAVPARGSRRGNPAELEGFEVRNAVAPQRGGAAVIVATETRRHLADATAALEAGFDVLVEKPLASSSEGVAALANLAARRGRRIFVGCCLRFDQGLLAFREQLPRIGDVRSVRVECQSWLPDWRPGTDYRAGYSADPDQGGVLRDLIHEIDYTCWLFGAPAEVYATLGNGGTLGIRAEETADLSWTTASGAAVSMRLDYLAKPARRGIVATGSRGDLVWNARPAPDAPVVVRRDLEGKIEETRSGQSRDDVYLEQARAFLSAVAGGEPGSLATLEEGAVALAVIDAARRSHQSGRREPVRDWRIP